jgi:DNA-binding transcriptional LysR family regulator
VRLAEAAPQDMGAVRIGDGLRFLAVAAPPYLAEREPLVTPEHLRNHRCIRQRLPTGKLYRWEFAKHGQEVSVDAAGVLTLDHSGLMAEAAAEG